MTNRDDLVKLCNLPYFGMENRHVILDVENFPILTTCCGNPFPIVPWSAPEKLLTLLQNIIYIATKRDKQIKPSAIPYFWMGSLLVMSGLENYSNFITCWGCPSPISSLIKKALFHIFERGIHCWCQN